MDLCPHTLHSYKSLPLTPLPRDIHEHDLISRTFYVFIYIIGVLYGEIISDKYE